MSLTFKLVSLAVRTAAKPIGNYIKRQAREHEGFRRFAINQAQRVHRIDMRMRLGILHDPEAQQRMHEREQRAAEEKKKKAEAPTVRSEEQQKKHDEQKAQDKEERKDEKKEENRQKVKIRPLSDARAIELGANFFSETFIFAVAVSLLLLENYRSSRKSNQRRDEVAERIEALEAQVGRLQEEHHLPELEALNEKIKKSREARNKYSWYNPAGWWRRTDPDIRDDDDGGVPGEVEEFGSKKRIHGNVPGPPPEQAVKPPPPSEAKSEVQPKHGGSDKAGALAKAGGLEKAAPSAATVERIDSVKASKKER
ncbi:hypothetical protein LTR37_004680 [Vermiconidia calcicola]|uniref:Uncharacterized protein n=1 Tax=Vermiconidia calcicola TaxID=1690605 RepID=A0ACC3NM89_9PEZI|nr:hypothetical protein LTR37_004680 [Vermiconidia calcicola]